jgi:hypothetical protein
MRTHISRLPFSTDIQLQIWNNLQFFKSIPPATITLPTVGEWPGDTPFYPPIVIQQQEIVYRVLPDFTSSQVDGVLDHRNFHFRHHPPHNEGWYGTD